MRSFLAVDLPDDVRAALVRVGDRLPGAVRRVRPEALHLTLRFLGDIDDEQVPALIEALRAATRRAPASLVLAGGGAFPSPVRPRVLWAGLRGDLEELHDLARAVEQAVVAAGLPPEPRPFHPHVTLGRVKGRVPRRVVDELAALPDLGEVPLDAVVLYESELLPEGARHTVVHRFPLEVA